MRVTGSRRGPLAGLRVVAVEQYGAGPFGSLYLADLGADVIKIEDPGAGGDVSRHVPPGRADGDSLFFQAFNRNKRSVALDLKNTAGRGVFDRIVASADAVYSNLRGDLPARLRIRYSDLAGVNPAVVCVTLSGYGLHGRDATRPGYDAMVQAEAGWAAVTGDPHGPPQKSGLSLADYVGGLTAAVGLLAGVIDARRSGRGQDVDTNLYDAALAMLTYPATWYLSSGFDSPRRPLSAHPSIVPFQFFETSDGYVAIACAKEKFFRALAIGIGLPELATDPRFADFESRDRHRDVLLEILGRRIRTKATSEWLVDLADVVPVAPVRALSDVLDPAELQDRGMLAEFDHPALGKVRSIGLPIAMGDYVPTYRPGPALGADGPAILLELGYRLSDLIELEQAGAFGTPGNAHPAADPT
jgi:crotonobetainyl-CoA:carnitine CoA-transferase CaiB-like acyl-CoA transferase